MKDISRHPDFPVSEKIYRRLLRAYPKAHRAEYGPAMVQLFRDQCRDVWGESRNWGLLKLWLRILPDLVSTSILERLAALNERKTMTDKFANLFSFRATPTKAFFRFFALVFILVFGMSVIITFILPESYASTARIQVEKDSVATPGFTSENDPYSLQKTFEIIQSQVVLDPVIEKLKLNEKWGKKYNNGVVLKTADTLQLLQQRLALEPVRNTELINVTAYSEDRNEAAQIANAIAKSYQAYRDKLQADLAMKRIEPLRNQYQQEGERIQQAQTNLESLRQQFKIASDATVSQSPREKPYWDKKRDLENMIEFHKLLQAKIASETVDASLPKSSPVTFIDKAKPGMRPARPNKPLNIIVGTIAGIFLASMAGTIAAFAAFFIKNRMHKTSTAI